MVTPPRVVAIPELPPPRRRWAFLCLALLALDWTRAPADQLSAKLLLGSIHAYQATLSPLMPILGVRCRFTPSCSHYAAGAVEKYGAFRGTLLAAWRVLRCGPWTRAGTADPP